MSDNLPKGTRKMEAVKRYPVETQVSITASILSSLAIAGSATETEEPIKGVMKELNVATIKAGRLFESFFISVLQSDCAIDLFRP